MTTRTGMNYTYSNTVPQKRMITDRIVNTSPHEITTLLALGGLNGAGKFSFVNQPHRLYEWLEEALPAVSETTVDANMDDNTTETTITVTTGALFQVGDVLQMDSDAELIYVSSISGNDLTVVRGFGGTTATSHATNGTTYIRYNARLEGADSSDSPFTEATSGYNYSTILHKDVTVSRTANILRNYGMGAAVDHQIDMNMIVLLQQMNRLPYYGGRAVGTTTTARSSGGLGTFITTNTTALASAALTQKHIDDDFQTIFTAGGVTDLILTTAWNQRKINSFYEGFVVTERSENVGGMIIKKLQHPITGVMVDVIVDRACPAGNMYLLDKKFIGYLEIDPFFYEDLAKTGDSFNGETVGEYGFVVQHNAAHSIISGASTSA